MLHPDFPHKNPLLDDADERKTSADIGRNSAHSDDQQHKDLVTERSDLSTRGKLAAPKNTELTVSMDRNASTPFRGSPSVSPRRKKPHPGPIIIPASVNNKVTHSVTFSGSTTRPLSPPVRRDYHNAPIYTPPPMLSPRSIFFTGAACGTPRSAIPLTPGRLLLSGRKLSTTEPGKDEETETPVAFPEP